MANKERAEMVCIRPARIFTKATLKPRSFLYSNDSLASFVKSTLGPLRTEKLARGGSYKSTAGYHNQYQSTKRVPSGTGLAPRPFFHLKVSTSNILALALRQAPLASSGLAQSHTQVWKPEQRRYVTSTTALSVWGGSGAAITALHTSLGIPHWACFAAISIAVRTVLFPLVLYGAHTSTRFAKIVPEVQFLVSIFQQDMKRLREQKAPLKERWGLMRTNIATLGGLYKLHNVKPWAIFLSPLLQLPIFWYVSVDLRKIVNGLDPELAQNLVENGILWIPDLTEADPWFGLPVMAGFLMYMNVEAALGRRSLSGPSVGKADTGVLLKDVFQSLAVFMPCFTSQLAGGVQIYITTSFAFTLIQSAALRSNPFRSLVGLPMISSQPQDTADAAPYAQQFIQLKQLEQKAKEMRGDKPLLGTGVLAAGLECSFDGSNRVSSIQGSDPAQLTAPSATSISNTIEDKHDIDLDPQTIASLLPQGTPLVHGVTAPISVLRERRDVALAAAKSNAKVDDPSVAPRETYMPHIGEEAIIKANRGEYHSPSMLPQPTAPKPPSKLNVGRLKRKHQRGRKKKR